MSPALNDRLVPVGETVVDRLVHSASTRPDALAFRFLSDARGEPSELTYAGFWRRVSGVAAALGRVAKPGDRAILLCRAGLDSVVALYGAMTAGLVAVPVQAPHPERIAIQGSGLVAAVRDCGPAVIIASDEFMERRDAFAQFAWELAVPAWVEAGASADGPAPRSSWDPDELAVIQYTSGSTSAPKGVLLTHRCVTANQQQVAQITGPTRQSALFSWLPFYHDLGLAFYLQTVHLGIGCTLMSPARFMQDSTRWLTAIFEYGCTGAAAPNFALDRVIRQFRGDAPAGFDLSGLRMLAIGAEPVRANTLDRFAELMAPYGFRQEALFPCYGLAECTMMATAAPLGRPTVRGFSTQALERGVAAGLDAEAIQRHDEGDREVRLVGNGQPDAHHELVVVDRATRAPLPDGQVGEIWIRGPSVGRGYWNKPVESQATFGARLAGDETGEPYLRTGDIGFMLDGDLYVSGRSSDTIIVRGRNIFPDDVEASVRNCHALVGEGVAAFEVVTPAPGLALVAELNGRRVEAFDQIIQDIRRSVGRHHYVEVVAIGLTTPMSLPRTSSAKIQRKRVRDLYLGDGLPLVADWRLAEGEAVLAEVGGE
jgi:acyl-CoA synthetase (AMP-forming)/AMP-acid ligase II|nr:fatty acyl-AMP ligase [Phenylobacterium sp.]